MFDYRKKCAERLNDFVLSKIQEFQDEIDKKNKETQETNKKNKAHAKITGNSVGMIVTYSKEDKFTQTKLVDEINKKTGIGLTQQMLHLYCKGTSYPPVPTLYKLAEYFNVSYDYLAGIDDVENPNNLSVQQLINLDDNAINTLLYLTQKTCVRDSLNALLQDKYFLHNLIAEIEIYMYQQQLLDARKKSSFISEKTYVEEKNHLYLERFTKLSSLYDYWEQNLLSQLQPSFDSRILNQLNEDFARTSNYDPSQGVPSSAVEVDPSNVKVLGVTIIDPKDSQ